MFDQFERRAKFVMQAVGAVADYGQAAATQQAIRPESSNDYVPTRLD
jgi:hypothetical protein